MHHYPILLGRQPYYDCYKKRMIKKSKILIFISHLAKIINFNDKIM
ncbi:hypothetical protein A1OE_875 [Candidatus Endolissoclinum faulkneri L2]|uniref:Uncharacterized protein n=1 Tax=Candidatus Endolissoclinum faulkneri L2 TaxID=1193729 RepID=K7YR99_9PROT|nr:hypothetical protein A1OE_875 [Candidatus Endolissoclinum faulkneri L2]